MDSEEHLIIGAITLRSMYMIIGSSDGHEMQAIHDRFKAWAFTHNYTPEDVKFIDKVLAMLTVGSKSISDKQVKQIKLCIKTLRLREVENGR